MFDDIFTMQKETYRVVEKFSEDDHIRKYIVLQMYQ